MTRRQLFAPTIVLVSICLVASLMLAVTYQVTAPKIAQAGMEAANKSRAEALPAGSGFTRIENVAQIYDGVTDIYKADNGAGYVITSQSKGFGGQITVMTGIGPDGKIVKVVVTDASSETPGLGSKTTLPDYTDQYTGASRVTNDKNDTLATYIHAVTGASYSSRAVFSCVSTALMQYAELGGIN